MPLVLITGSATSGKTTIASELKKRGFDARDTEDNLSGWFTKDTNKAVKTPWHMSQDWHSKHIWLINVDKVQEISRNSKNKTVILCGIAQNIDQIIDLCDKVIWLKVDEATIRKRVNLPDRENRWGRKPYQLEFTISLNKRLEEFYKDHGAIIIDANKPLEEVIEDVLAKIQ